MPEHSRAVFRQVFNEPDGGLLDLAEQVAEPPLTFMQRQVAQIVAVQFQKVEGVQHRLPAAVSAPQCMKVWHAVAAHNHGPAVDQERLRLDAERSLNDARKVVDQSLPLRVKQRMC